MPNKCRKINKKMLKQNNLRQIKLLNYAQER